MISRSLLGKVAACALVLAMGIPAEAKPRGAKHKAVKATPTLAIPNARLEPVPFTEIDGWAEDDHAAGFATFLASCRAVVKRKAGDRDRRVMHRGLIDVCRRALHAGPLDAAKARAFFESHFRPVRIAPLEQNSGFLTGYYEPIVDGSRTASADYSVPVYRRPGDLVVPGLRKGAKKASLPNGGKVGRRAGKTVVPFFERAEIEDGALKGRGAEICWLKDPIDLFFSQIQGSARVRLSDGSSLRLNYDAHNGHPYTPVGRILIERKIYTREEMSMDRIREWMEANPDEGRDLRRMNKSYVFFRVVELGEHDEPIGAQGIPLTAGRSIAIDRKLHVYGTPFFVQAELPIDDDTPTTRFRRLMVAQDTGSAIVGPARADIYFGAGEIPGQIGGRIKNPGRFVMLVPNEVDPVTSGRRVPLPRPRPALAGEVSASVPLPLPRPAGRSRS